MRHPEQVENQIERRAGSVDRRACEERRSEERLSLMKKDCRKNLPRRDSDMDGLMVEGELWWSSSQQFF